MTKVIIQTNTNITEYYQQTKDHLLEKYHDYPTKLKSGQRRHHSENVTIGQDPKKKLVDIGKRVV